MRVQAASSLERGDATCAKCRGAGALSCSACKVSHLHPYVTLIIEGPWPRAESL